MTLSRTPKKALVTLVLLAAVAASGAFAVSGIRHYVALQRELSSIESSIRMLEDTRKSAAEQASVSASLPRLAPPNWFEVLSREVESASQQSGTIVIKVAAGTTVSQGTSGSKETGSTLVGTFAVEIELSGSADRLLSALDLLEKSVQGWKIDSILLDISQGSESKIKISGTVYFAAGNERG